MTSHHHKKGHHDREDDAFRLMALEPHAAPLPPPTGDTYKIAAYADGLVGASPDCDVLRPKYDSGIKYAGSEPNPEAPCWGRGISGGIRWDGTFHRDLSRYSGSGDLFWSSYLKPGSAPGMKAGYWINFGSGWSHLHNDNPAEILTGASQKLFWEPAVAGIADPGQPGSPTPATTGQWKLVIQATKFVTHEVIEVWTGTKTGGSDPTGTYTRDSGIDPVATLTVEAA